jgi:hypothetical protein
MLEALLLDPIRLPHVPAVDIATNALHQLGAQMTKQRYA